MAKKKKKDKDSEKSVSMMTISHRFEPISVTQKVGKKTVSRAISSDEGEDIVKNCMSKLTNIYNDLMNESQNRWIVRSFLSSRASKVSFWTKHNELVKPIKFGSKKSNTNNWTFRRALYLQSLVLQQSLTLVSSLMGGHLSGYGLVKCQITSLGWFPRPHWSEKNPDLNAPKEKKWVQTGVISIKEGLNFLNTLMPNPIQEGLIRAIDHWNKFAVGKNGSTRYVDFPGKFDWANKASGHPTKIWNFSKVNEYVGYEVYGGWSSYFKLLSNSKVKNKPPRFRDLDTLTNIQYTNRMKLGVVNGVVFFPPSKEEKDWIVQFSFGTKRPDGIRNIRGRLVGSGKENTIFSSIEVNMVKLAINSLGVLKCQIVVNIDKTPEENRIYLPHRWQKRLAGPSAVQEEPVLHAAIDLGMVNIMSVVFSDCSQYIYTGKGLYSNRYFWLGKRGKIQRQNGKIKPTDKCHRADKEFAENYLHQISSHLINLCQKKGTKEIVMGDLTDIRHNKRGNDRRKSSNKYQKHSWTFAKLQEMITYKGAQAGIKVRFVSEAYTSQTCCACGIIHKGNRGRVKDPSRMTKRKKKGSKNRGNYHCYRDGNGGLGCGREFNSDLNGGVNIFSDNYNYNPWEERLKRKEKTSMTGIPGKAFKVLWAQNELGAGLVSRPIT